MLSEGNNLGKSSGSTLDMPISANPAITLAIPVGCEDKTARERSWYETMVSYLRSDHEKVIPNLRYWKQRCTIE